MTCSGLLYVKFTANLTADRCSGRGEMRLRCVVTTSKQLSKLKSCNSEPELIEIKMEYRPKVAGLKHK